MSTRPFRFVHAGDFHLEQPLRGVAEVPEHLRELFVDAPYAAAQKVFDAVLAEDADFLVLSGDLLHPLHTGPRGPLFLVEQFQRLAERGIDVYWAGGAVDPPEAWPAVLALPQNVHLFSQGRVEEATVLHDEEPLARLAGVSRERRRTVRSMDFSPDPTGLYSIAVMHGEADVSAIQTRGFHYWALGGRYDRSTPLSDPHVVHHCGSPQGRCPEHGGVHGCTLIEVDPQRQTRMSFIPTDVVRWHVERVAIDEATTPEDLKTRLREHMGALLDALPSLSLLPKREGTTDLLVSWTIVGKGPMISQLRRTKLAAEWLQQLRDDYGHRSPAAWSVALEVELSETLPPEWYEQETIRGDFLRAVRQFQMNPDESPSLEAYMAESHLAGVLATAATFSNKTDRDRVLREAAVLGVDLLSGEESQV